MSQESDVAIDDGVPFPVRKQDRYPFGKMEVGQSFKLKKGMVVKKVRAAASHYGLRHPPAKFSIRVTDPTRKIHRCWRIA